MLNFTPARLLVPIIGATALAGAALASPSTSATTPAADAAPTSDAVASAQEATPIVRTSSPAGTEREASDHQETTPILCGGYDAQGNLVDPRAAETTEVPVDPDGSYDIPGFCRGYTADGTFVGDD